MANTSTARTHWEGDLASGSGKTALQSGIGGEMKVSWGARTEGGEGQTTPEELIAAAHASCFSMALSAGLARNETPPESLDTAATVTFDRVNGGFRIVLIHLRVRGNVPGIDEETFARIAETAKENCPVSQALKGNVEITLDAALG